MAHIPGGLRTRECQSEDTTAGGFLVLIGNECEREGGGGGSFLAAASIPSPTRPAGRRNRGDELKYQWSVLSVSGVYL